MEWYYQNIFIRNIKNWVAFQIEKLSKNYLSHNKLHKISESDMLLHKISESITLLHKISKSISITIRCQVYPWPIALRLPSMTFTEGVLFHRRESPLDSFNYRSRGVVHLSVKYVLTETHTLQDSLV